MANDISKVDNPYELKLRQAGVLKPLSTYLSDPLDMDRLAAGFPGQNVIDVRQFGSLGSADDAAVIQAGIDYITSSVYGGVLSIPAGAWNVSTITLKPNVVIVGQSERTEFVSVGADSGALVTRAPGQMYRIGLKNIFLRGNQSHTNKWLLNLVCDAQGGSDGSVTDAIFEFVMFRFSRKNIRIQGTLSGSGYTEPFQWTVFRQCRVEALDSASTEILTILGQTGQVTFDVCAFGSIQAGGTALTPYAVTLANSGSVSPVDISFRRCWFGNVYSAANIAAGATINFDGCWMENIGHNGFTFAGGTYGAVTNSIFSSSASGTGTAITVDGSGQVTVGNNRISQTYAVAYKGTNGGRLTNQGGLIYSSGAAGTLSSSGTTQVTGVLGTGTGASGTGYLSAGNYKSMIITGNTVEIQFINGDHCAGEVFTVMASGGSLVFNNAASGSNISLAGTASGPITVPANATASFMVMDGSGVKRYRLISIGMYTPQVSSVPAWSSGIKGMVVFDLSANKLKVAGAAAWETITSA